MSREPLSAHWSTTTGCSYGLVRALLKEAGVTLRARARASASAKPLRY